MCNVRSPGHILEYSAIGGCCLVGPGRSLQAAVNGEGGGRKGGEIMQFSLHFRTTMKIGRKFMNVCEERDLYAVREGEKEWGFKIEA